MFDDALRQIKTLLGPPGIIDDAAGMHPHLVSWRNGWEGKASFIALPNSTQQVSKILAICHKKCISVVPQGGNTGLVGGAIPSTEGNQIVVNLSRLNKIRAFDKAGSAVTTEAGVILQTLQEEADKAGFLFPLSMASQGSAQIGGAIATNAGGTAVLRYGNMRELVLGLEAVLPDGTIYAGLKNLPKDNTGYNLAQVFIGSEGTLGIITAAVLKLFPRMAQTVTGFAAVKNPQAAMELLARFRESCGEQLSAFEIISNATLKLVVKNIPGARLPCRDDTPYYILIELSSASPQIPLRDMFETALSAAMEKGDVTDAVIAENTAQAKQFWSLREHASEALRKEGPGAHFDISVPLAQIAEFLAEMESRVLALAPGIILAPFGHLGDGNIHYNMSLPPGMNDDARANLKKRAQELVYGEVTRRGGSISAEHGVGLERKAELLRTKPLETITLMRALKKTFDPAGIMNPGKIFDA
jgi:FAD/FMN-containing dehydrogenase